MQGLTRILDTHEGWDFDLEIMEALE